MRRLYHCVKRYSGEDPQMIDGDIFRVIVPLDDDYSYDMGMGKAQNKAQNKAHLKHKENNSECALNEKILLEYLAVNPHATQIEIASAVGKTRRGVQEAIARLKEKGLIKREGARKNGKRVVG